MKIIITGTTGVGKSTTVEILERKIQKKNVPVIRIGELVVDSEFFDYYFNNMSGWGFLSQTSFLLDRFKQWLEVENKINNYVSGAVNIFDRHFLDDLIFSDLYWVRQSISHIDTLSYKIIYNELLSKLKDSEKIDYFFLLKADFETIKTRMLGRGRENEVSFNEKYWIDLYNKYYTIPYYQQHFKDYSERMITIDTKNKKPEIVAQEIFSYIEKDLGKK